MGHTIRVVLHVTMIEAHPEILAQRHSDTEIVIFQWNLDEGLKAKGQGWDKVLKIIQEARKKGHVKIDMSDPPGFALHSALGQEELGFVKLVEKMRDNFAKENHGEVVIATKSRPIQEYCSQKRVNIRTYQRLSDIPNWPEAGWEVDATIKQMAEDVALSPQYAHIGFGVGIGIAFVMLLGSYELLNNTSLLNHISPWIIVPGALVLGLAMFGWKEYYLFSYGWTELFFGIGSLLVLVIYQPVALKGIPDVLKILSPVYIIVRGLENINKGSRGAPLRKVLLPAKRVLSQLFPW